MNDLLIRACRREKVPHPPVWLMRQAGRYLPDYRKVRAKTDFLQLCYTPELAVELTLQPIDILGVDAAIIFSDILLLAQAMGMTLRFTEGQGPIFDDPIRNTNAIDTLDARYLDEKLSAVFTAIKLARRTLADRVPLIGFAGAPWTLAAYMIEGKASKNFITIKRFLYAEPRLLQRLLDKLVPAIADLLIQQIKSGAQLVQIFDSWAGILTPDAYCSIALPPIQRIIERIKNVYDDIPIILFARDAQHSLTALANSGADVLSLSWTADITTARRCVQSHVALQGNLDPCVLLAPEASIKTEVIKLLSKAGQNPGYIVNLGHGILPQTPVKHAKIFVDIVKNTDPYDRK